MYSKVISILFFLAKRSKCRPRHSHIVTPIRAILITFDLKGFKSNHSNFHEDMLKSVGGVCQIPMPEITKTCNSPLI